MPTNAPNNHCLAEKQAISEQIYRYCRAVDRLDETLGCAIWHPQGQADYGDFYRGDGYGVIKLIIAQHRFCLAHSHQVSNILIQCAGDNASSESYVTATVRLAKDEQILQMTMWCRYLDRWQKTDGSWLLLLRTTLRDFDESRIITPISGDDPKVARDTSDASYAYLGH